MTLVELSEIARSWWGVWLMLLFIVIVAWAIWPSAARNEEMRRNAMIPFRNDDDDAANTEPR